MHFRVSLLPFLVCAFAPAVTAQVVDYPDSVITSPAGQYPIYTPTNGNTCRVQIYCPSTFAGLPTQKSIISKVGFQLAGQEDYTTFIVRAGTTSVAALTTNWVTNLPDQRVQFDLSGTKLMGGLQNNTPVNIWVDYEIAYPFVFTPGDALVMDVTSKSKVAGTYCRTAIGTGVPRAYDLAYVNSTGPTTTSTSGGIKLRFVFQPLQFVSYGQSCPGAGSFKPALAITGNMNPGQVVRINLANALGGAPTLFFLGLTPLPFYLPLGGECLLLTPLDFVTATAASGTGAGQGAATQPVFIPNVPALIGGVVNTQWAQLDPASAAAVPFTLSNGGKIVIY